MLETYVILPLLLGIIIIVTELKRRRSFPFDFLMLINIVFFISFVIGPVLIYMCHIMSLTNGWEGHTGFASSSFIIAGFLPVGAYLCLAAGYYSGNKLALRQIGDIGSERHLLAMALLLLVFGGVAYYKYAEIYGGLFNLLKYSDGIRAGWYTTDSPLVFLRRFGGFCAVSSFILLGLCHRTLSIRNIFTCLLFVVSFLMSLFVFWTWAGRLTFIAYCVTIYLSIIIFRGRWTSLDMTLLISLSLFIIITGDSYFKVLMNSGGSLDVLAQVRDNKSLIGSFASELGFPAVTLSKSVTLFGMEIGPRWLIGDWLIGFSKLLPERLLGLNMPESLSELNTSIGFPDATGTVPVDILSFAYYSAGPPGILIWPFLVGLSVRMLERYLLLFKGNRCMAVFYSAWGISLASYIMYGDPDHFLQGNFCLIVGFFLVLLFIRRRKHV